MQQVPSIAINPRHALLSVQTRLDQISRYRLGLHINEEEPYNWLFARRTTLSRTAFYWLLMISGGMGALLCLTLATGAFLLLSHYRFAIYLITGTLLLAFVYLCWHWWKRPERFDQALLAWIETESPSLIQQYLTGYLTPIEATTQLLDKTFAPTDAVWPRILLGRSRYSAFTLVASPSIAIPLPKPHRAYFYDLSPTDYLLRIEVPFGKDFTLTAWYQVPKEVNSPASNHRDI